MNEHQIRWDDLQIVLAVAETGSLSGAGRQLNLSHATVFRRLGELERKLGVALFNRTRSGYEQTPAGEDLARSAAKVRDEIASAERRIAGRDLSLSGVIRLTTTDTLFAGLLAPILDQFRSRHPDIEIELLISNQVYSLSKREADIAIRPTNRPPETLVGRRVADIEQAVYGKKSRWEDTELPLPIDRLETADWVGPDAHLGDRGLENWMSNEIGSARCQYRIDSLLGVKHAIREGSGIGVLSTYLGESDPELIRLSDPIQPLATQLWILTHPDLRRVARISSFIDEIGEAIREYFLPA